MCLRFGVVFVWVVVLFVFFLSGGNDARSPYVRGRNHTVLFLANDQSGLSNVHTATASALLETFAEVEVHFASFPKLWKRLERVTSFARAKNPSANINFHELKGRSFQDALVAAGKPIAGTIHSPASAGIAHLTADLQLYLAPWTVEDHLELYHELCALIDKVDPAVVVLDTAFRPAIDATRDRNRQHAFVTPNTAVDNFLGHQPRGSMFWKYPAMGSGFSFPVPWKDMPENIYLNLRFIYSLIKTPNLSYKKAILRTRGLKDPINFFDIHRNDVPWVSMTTEGATIPVQYIPPNVTCAGPIVLSGAPVVKQDADLAAWLQNAPTVLVNLGGNFGYSKYQAASMVGAIVEILSTTRVQILWKFNKGEIPYSDNVLEPLQPYLDAGQLRVSKWLSVDPVSLLETGNIVASVHHGGSNCYHEAVAAGVAQVILPLWLDLYNFAALAEDLGIGVWGCRATSPVWTVNCLSRAITRVVDGGEESVNMHKTAKELGYSVKARGQGRDIAAREIAKTACVGCANIWNEDESCRRIMQGA